MIFPHYSGLILILSVERKPLMDLDAIFRLMERAEQSAFIKVDVQQGDLHIILERGAVAPASAPAMTAQPKTVWRSNQWQ